MSKTPSHLKTGITIKTVPQSKTKHMGKHNPIYTKHRKGKRQFKRKNDHWSQL